MVATDSSSTSLTSKMISLKPDETHEEVVKTSSFCKGDDHEESTCTCTTNEGESSSFEDEQEDSPSSEFHSSNNEHVPSSSPTAGASPRGRRRRMVRFLGARNVLALGDDFVEDGLQVHLMKNIISVKDDLSNYENDFLERSSIHLEKAKARLEVGNQRGAILSMRKIHKMRLQQIAARASVKELIALEAEVESQIWSNWSVARTSYLKFGRRLSIGKELPSLDMYKEKLNDILTSFDLCTSVSYPGDEEMEEELHRLANFNWSLESESQIAIA